MSPAAEERLLLVLVGEDRAGAELPRQGVLTVGSSRDRAVFHVEGPGIESVHCAIARTKGGGWAIKDLGTATGTLVNGRRIEAVRLKAGDRIHVGGRELRILAPAGTADASRTDKAGTDKARADETGAFEPQSGKAPAGSERTPRPDEPAVELASAPPILSGYRIERPLGRGGMGSVYLAMQTSLDRPVALKVLAPKFASDAEFVRRFQAEARAAAALAHPNVVTVYDVGEERGIHYLSMEYMDHGTLEERVAGGRKLTWAETLEVLRDAAAGLVYAEAKGIVHRDLKPANLMQNHVGTTKIADLGLATHVEAEERESAEKKVFGTPHFMSPEQARGERVDGRSDLYSLGATAYRLLTGHTPFEGTNAREIVRAHLSLEPRPLRDFAPELPDDALALVARLMRKIPAERFASATELAREIDRLRTRTAALAAPATTQRSSGGRKAALALALILLLGGGAWWLNGHPEILGGSPSSLPPPRDSGPVAGAANEPAPPDAPDDPASVVPPAPDAVTTATPETPRDDDKALQLLEANARVALLELLGQEMTPEQKRDALRALAGAWRGTTAASEAVDKAQKIDSDLSTRAAADVEQQARLDELVARLQSAAGAGEVPPRPGQTLLNMRAVPGQAAFAANSAFVARRKEIERAVVSRAAAFARAKVDETAEQMSKGQFEGVQEKLTELMPVFELPDFPPGEGPAGVDELFEIGRTARERLNNLALLKVQFVSQQSRDDGLAIAQGLGGTSGLERELRTLDFAAAKERLGAIQGKLAAKESRALLEGLRSDLDGAASVLHTLGREFPTWRRKGFTEPRGAKSVTRNAVGADADGILAEGEGGAVEHVPWSAFGADGHEIAKLFTERLAREWSPEEMRGIAGLLKVTAVVEAIARVGKMLDPAKRYNFTENDAREILECFAPAQAWAERAGTVETVAKEVAAARQLTLVCQRMTEGAWSVAVGTTEDLLARYADTLLVRLLSDGTIPEAPKPKEPVPKDPKSKEKD